MQIFLDTANTDELRSWLAAGVIDGLTTNPSIILKEGVADLASQVRELCGLLGDRPCSIEVVTNEAREMLIQAREFARWGSNIVVKIPIVTDAGIPCLEVINQLTREGIRVNVTACLSFGQAMLATKAGASYVSLFAGRIADEGHDPAIVIRNTRRWLDLWALNSRIIVGSIRSVIDIQQAALAGAHVVTIPPQFMTKLADHKYSRFTVAVLVYRPPALMKSGDFDRGWTNPPVSGTVG